MIRGTTTFLLLLLSTLTSAFTTTSRSSFVPMRNLNTPSKPSSSCLSMKVVDITSEAAFDKTISSAGDSLVIVDYSTTWCGPCKVIKPKFDEMSDKYPNAVFLSVIGDASADASRLMKREGVRSVPSFHYFLNGEKVDVVNGANAEAIEAAINKHSR